LTWYRLVKPFTLVYIAHCAWKIWFVQLDQFRARSDSALSDVASYSFKSLTAAQKAWNGPWKAWPQHSMPWVDISKNCNYYSGSFLVRSNRAVHSTIILAHYLPIISSLSVSSKPNMILKPWMSKTIHKILFYLSKF
jgi:hypothetical protein